MGGKQRGTIDVDRECGVELGQVGNQLKRAERIFTERGKLAVSAGHAAQNNLVL